MDSEFLLALANESDLNSLLGGTPAGTVLPWRGGRSFRLDGDGFAVLGKMLSRNGDILRPLVLVAREEEHRRLFGRLAQLRSDLSPLTSWCHLMTPNRFASVDLLSRDADLSGFEAAWTGLVVAEALLLSEIPVSKLKIAACLATQTFAIARTRALWNTSIKETLDRYDSAQHMFRARESRIIKLRSALEPIWECLASAQDPLSSPKSKFWPLVDGIRALYRARRDKEAEEGIILSLSMSQVVPEAEVLIGLSRLTPEQRVREFDKLVAALGRSAAGEGDVSRHALAMLCGYLATIAAGGAPSLSLAEAHVQRWPEITAWAYVLGSIGERIVWTSSFDGLGRLVARELVRPLRLDDGPACDFALDEAAILVDQQLSDPLVHLRIKQSRIVSVCLLPGVNILVPLGEQPVDARAGDNLAASARSALGGEGRIGADALDAISDAVWRRVRTRLETFLENWQRSSGASRSYEGTRSGKRSSSQSKLPLGEGGKK